MNGTVLQQLCPPSKHTGMWATQGTLSSSSIRTKQQEMREIRLNNMIYLSTSKMPSFRQLIDVRRTTWFAFFSHAKSLRSVLVLHSRPISIGLAVFQVVTGTGAYWVAQCRLRETEMLTHV